MKRIEWNDERKKNVKVKDTFAAIVTNENTTITSVRPEIVKPSVIYGYGLMVGLAVAMPEVAATEESEAVPAYTENYELYVRFHPTGEFSLVLPNFTYDEAELTSAIQDMIATIAPNKGTKVASHLELVADKYNVAMAYKAKAKAETDEAAGTDEHK